MFDDTFGSGKLQMWLRIKIDREEYFQEAKLNQKNKTERKMIHHFMSDGLFLYPHLFGIKFAVV